MKFRCWLFGHKWSTFEKCGDRYWYHFCRRCSASEVIP